MGDLGHRSRRILFAAITEFIATGDAVGSRTLARKYGLDLSAASIRNVLSDLEEAGYLKQPHTSAGRVPTDRALRLFIDTLMEVRAISPEDQAKIGAHFAEVFSGPGDPLRETGRLLSELSGQAAVLGPPRAEHRALAQLRFIPTKPGQILAVLVFSDGSVENRFLQIEGRLQEPELTRIHNLLADVIEGRTLGEVRDLFARRLADERTTFDQLRHKAFELGEAATRISRPATIVIEGQARLIDLPEYADVDRLKSLMRVLEEREDLVGLLDKTLAAGAVTGLRRAARRMSSEAASFSLVVAPYSDHGRAAGTVGVIGPTRMDYAKVMPLVDAAATAMSEALAKQTGR